MTPEQLKTLRLQDAIVPGGITYVREIKRGGYRYFINDMGLEMGRFPIPRTPWWIWVGVAYLTPWAIFLIMMLVESFK